MAVVLVAGEPYRRDVRPEDNGLADVRGGVSGGVHSTPAGVRRPDTTGHSTEAFRS